MESGRKNKKEIDVMRLKADVAATSVELLSAHCATDRIRLQYSMQDIVAFGERHSLQRAIAAAEAVCRFFSQVQAHIKSQSDSSS